MKALFVFFGWLVIGLWPTVLQAQSTLEDLVTDYKSWSQEASETREKKALRKQDRAAVKLVNYIQKYGYPLSLSLTTSAPLVVYEEPYPVLGAALDTLDVEQVVQVYDKDQHGYYRIGTAVGQGYVSGLSEQFGSEDHPLYLLDEMLRRRAAADKMLDQARAQPRMRTEHLNNKRAPANDY